MRAGATALAPRAERRSSAGGLAACGPSAAPPGRFRTGVVGGGTLLRYDALDGDGRASEFAGGWPSATYIANWARL